MRETVSHIYQFSIGALAFAMPFNRFLGTSLPGLRVSSISRLSICFRPTQRTVQEFASTSRRGFWVESKVQLSPRMQEHYLDRAEVESFTVPGAKVFDRYFDLPLGKLISLKKTPMTHTCLAPTD